MMPLTEGSTRGKTQSHSDRWLPGSGGRERVSWGEGHVLNLALGVASKGCAFAKTD